MKTTRPMKRILGILLAISMLLGTVPVTFADVTGDDYVSNFTYSIKDGTFQLNITPGSQHNAASSFYFFLVPKTAYDETYADANFLESGESSEALNGIKDSLSLDTGLIYGITTPGESTKTITLAEEELGDTNGGSAWKTADLKNTDFTICVWSGDQIDSQTMVIDNFATNENGEYFVDTRTDLTGTVDIGSDVEVGTDLEVKNSSGFPTDLNTTNYNYQWVRTTGGTDANIGTGATYKTTTDDIGENITIKLVVSAKPDSTTHKGSVTSNAVTVNKKTPTAPTGTITKTYTDGLTFAGLEGDLDALTGGTGSWNFSSTGAVDVDTHSGNIVSVATAEYVGGTTGTVGITISPANTTASCTATAAELEVYSGTTLASLNSWLTSKFKATEAGKTDVNVTGTFAWANDAPTTISGAAGAKVNVSYQFTSTNKNYNNAGGQIKFTIKGADTTTLDDLGSRTYNGNAESLPTPVVKAGGTTLTAGTDYTVSWTAKNGSTITADNKVTDVDDYTCHITMTNGGKYQAPQDKVYKVTKATASFTVSGTLTYNGQKQFPTVTVTGKKGALTEGTDYTVDVATGSNGIDAGSHTVIVTMKNPNYNNPNGNGAYSIGKANLSWGAPTLTVTKVYDGNGNNAAVTGTVAVTGGVTGETITATAKGSAKGTISGDVNAGTGKNYSVAAGQFDFAVTGGQAKISNYNVPTGAVTGATASITAKQLSWGTPSLTVTKEYDGNGNNVPVSGTVAVTGAVNGDVITATAKADAKGTITGNFNVGTGKNFTVANDQITVAATSGQLSNYTLPTGAVTGNTASITAKALSWGDASNLTATKVYDGNGNNAAVSGTVAVTGAVNGDVITATAKADAKGTITGTDFNVGTDKGFTVNADQITVAATSGQLSNYTLPTGAVTGTKGTITPAPLTVSPVLAEPVKGGTPATSVTGLTNATAGTVTWNPADDTFLAGKSYTATFTVTADGNHTFANNNCVNKISGSATTTATANNAGTAGNTANVTVTYGALSAKTLTAITVTDGLAITATSGDTLSLDSVKMTLEYDDGTTETDVSFDPAQFTFSIGGGAATTTMPKLTVANHNAKTITIHKSGVNSTPAINLTVNKKTLTKIEVTTDPTKMSYNPGESVNKAGAVITATYSDGSTVDVTAAATVKAPAGALTTANDGDKVTFAYKQQETEEIKDAVEMTADTTNPLSVGKIQLDKPVNLTWDGITAKWDAVPNASSYTVQLKKDGTDLGDPVAVPTGTEYDFTDVVTPAGNGTYTFVVTAIGDDVTYSNSPASDPSPELTRGDDDKGTLTVTYKDLEKVYNGEAQAAEIEKIEAAGADVTADFTGKYHLEYQIGEGEFGIDAPVNVGTHKVKLVMDDAGLIGTYTQPSAVNYVITPAPLTWNSSEVFEPIVKVYDKTADAAVSEDTDVDVTALITGIMAADTDVTVTMKKDAKGAYQDSAEDANDAANVGEKNANFAKDDFTISSNNYVMAEPVVIAGKITPATIDKPGQPSGTAKQGSTLSALTVTASDKQLSGLTKETDFTIQWYRATSKDEAGTAIEGATDLKYTLTTSDVNMYLYYTLTGVGNYDETPVESDKTAQIQKKSSGGGGGSRPTPKPVEYTVSFSEGSSGKIVDGETSMKVKQNESPESVPTVQANDGFIFKGWSINGVNLVDPLETEITQDTTFTALYEQSETHSVYIIGRGENIFDPEGSLSRAEAVTMLDRLTDGFIDKPYKNDFSDIDATNWYFNYVTFGAQAGIVTGYPEGTFLPDGKVTRAEFAAMLARFTGIGTAQGASKFTDCSGHWSEGYIKALTDAGVIDGYADGTFRPQQNISREEAVKMINIAVGRVPNKEKVNANQAQYANPFSDVASSRWSYYDILEAALEHQVVDFH